MKTQVKSPATAKTSGKFSDLLAASKASQLIEADKNDNTGSNSDNNVSRELSRVNSSVASRAKITAKKVLIETSMASVEVSRIKVPAWYGKKYISQAELNRCIAAIENGDLAPEEIIVRYISGDDNEKYYELIAGLVHFKTKEKLGYSEVTCKVVEESQLSETDSMLVSMSRNSQVPLNPWESTILAMSFLIKKLNLKTNVEWVDVNVAGIETRERKITRDIDWAMGVCKNAIKLRNARAKLNSESKASEEAYLALQKKITPEKERIVDDMLDALGISLTTLVQKRFKLLSLPGDITTALKEGKIDCSNAVRISGVGKTKEIDSLYYRLGDTNVQEQIILERAQLLKDVVEKHLTKQEVIKRVQQANTRIFAIGTREDAAGLSEDEIGERRQVKEDLILVSQGKRSLRTIASLFQDFKIVDNLTEREKSRIQLSINSLEVQVLDLKKKALSRVTDEVAS